MIRKVEENDIEYILNLYEKFPDFKRPLISQLPNNGMDGYVSLKGDKIVAAAFVFMAANAPYCWISWAVADRDYKGDDKIGMLSTLITHITDVMSDGGWHYAFSFANEDQRLLEIYKDAGFYTDSKPTYEMIKTLQ